MEQQQKPDEPLPSDAESKLKLTDLERAVEDLDLEKAGEVEGGFQGIQLSGFQGGFQGGQTGFQGGFGGGGFQGGQGSQTGFQKGIGFG